MSKVINIIGYKGEGKTTYAESLIAGVPNLLVYDIYGEYKNLRIVEVDEDIINFAKRRVLGHKVDFKHLLKLMASDDFKNNFVLLEDATIYMDGYVHQEDIRKLLVATRHTNNTIIMLWHSLDDFSRPRHVFRNSDFIVLFRTTEQDEHKLVKKFYSKPEVMIAYESLKKKKTKYVKPVIIKLR